MATITNDKETGGKWLVKAIDNFGEDIEIFCETHWDAQVIATNESNNLVLYFDEFKVIDGLNQHRDGLNFREWLKKRNGTKN